LSNHIPHSLTDLTNPSLETQSSLKLNIPETVLEYYFKDLSGSQPLTAAAETQLANKLKSYAEAG